MLRKKNTKLSYRLNEINIKNYNFSDSFEALWYLTKNNIKTTLVGFLDVILFDILIKDIKLKEIILNILDPSINFTQNYVDELIQDINVNQVSKSTFKLLESIFTNFILGAEDIYRNSLYIINEISNFKNLDSNSYNFHHYSGGSFLLNSDDLIWILKNIIITKLLYIFEDSNRDNVKKYEDFLELFSPLVIQKIIPPEKSGIIFSDSKNMKVSIYGRLGSRSVNLEEYDIINFWIKSRSLEIKHIYTQEVMNVIKLNKNRISPIRELNIKLDEQSKDTVKIEENEILALLKVHKLLENFYNNCDYVLFWIINSGKLYIENISILLNKFIKLDEVDKFSKNIYQNIYSLDNQNFIKKSNIKPDGLGVNLNNNEQSAFSVNDKSDNKTKLTIKDSQLEEPNYNRTFGKNNFLNNSNLSYTVLKLDDLIGHRLISLIKQNKLITTVDNSSNLYLNKNSNVVLDISDMGSNKVYKSIYYDKLFLDLGVLLRLNDQNAELANLLDSKNKLDFINKLSLNFQIVFNVVKLKNNKLFIKLFLNNCDQVKNIKNILVLQILALHDANKSVNINYNRIFFVLPVLSSQSEYEFIIEELKTFTRDYKFTLNILPEILLPSTFFRINSFRGVKYILLDVMNLVRLIYNQNEISEELQEDFIDLLDTYVISLFKKRRSLDFIFKTSESLKIINKFLKNKNLNLLLVKYLSNN